MLSWTDLNNDKQPDLIVVGEWMPVKVFINQKGKLTDASPHIFILQAPVGGTGSMQMIWMGMVMRILSLVIAV